MENMHGNISPRKRVLALFLVVAMLWTMGLGDVAGALEPTQLIFPTGDASGNASGDASGDAHVTHTAGEAQQENVVPATCAVPGSYDEVVYCTVCGKELSRTAKIIEKVDHTAGEAQQENVVPATCAVSGSYDEVVYCTVCEKELSRTAKTIDKVAHTAGEWEVTTAATYSTVGTETQKCTVCEATLATREISMLTLSAPTVSAVENATTGAKVTWGKVKGAEKYRVYYKLSDASKWTTFKDVTGTSATVTGLTSGKNYVFTVKAFAGDNVSKTTASSAFAYCAMPKVSKVQNTTNGMQLTWSKVAGAEKYRIYYRIAGTTKWTRYKDVTGTSATVTGLTSGENYVFTVKAYNGSNWSAIQLTSAEVYRQIPKVTKLTNAIKGVTVTWNKVSGATKYALYFREKGTKEWTRVSNKLTTTSATVTDVKSGKYYVFAVKAYVGEGWSDIEISDAILRVSAVSITSLTNSSSKAMKVSWKSHTTITGYQIQYSLKSDFSNAKTVTIKSNGAGSKTIKSLTKGKTYYVRIRGYKTVNDSTVYGAWSATKSVKIAK